jgi:hypothetical protein
MNLGNMDENSQHRWHQSHRKYDHSDGTNKAYHEDQTWQHGSNFVYGWFWLMDWWMQLNIWGNLMTRIMVVIWIHGCQTYIFCFMHVIIMNSWFFFIYPHYFTHMVNFIQVKTYNICISKFSCIDTISSKIN